MTETTWGRLAGRMSTMSGFPGWSETMADNYFADLCDLPENVAAAMIPQVQKQFDGRPSVKQLREWAVSLSLRSSSGQMPDYLTPKAALTGAALAEAGCRKPLTNDRSSGDHLTNPAASVMGLLTDAGRETKKQGGAIPDVAKETLRWLREQAGKDGVAPVVGVSNRGNWGLEHVLPDGATRRLPARYSEAAARAKADEQSRAYSHLRVRVWCAESAEAVRLDREKEAVA